MEICHEPFRLEDALAESLREPPATLLVLPNGWVKVAAALPHACADLRRCTLAQAWDAYQQSWYTSTLMSAVRDAAQDDSLHAQANAWHMLTPVNA
jgi:hypothetical protein